MEMNYKLIYAKRKTISLKIEDDGSLTVRAPRFTPKAEIEKIIIRHKARLEIMRDRVQKKERALAEADLTKLEERLRATVFPLIEKYSAEMGKAPEKVKFTNAKGRFGSCSSRGTICLSRYLALYPEAAIEYVVVHEMAHLFEMNHSPRFYAIVEKNLPDYKERKKLLVLPNC